MELREWALAILTGSSLEEKLQMPEILTDQSPGPPLFIDEPRRAPSLRFSKHSKKDRLPPFESHSRKEARGSCLHRFCSHELLAVEMLAFALLAYPGAPKGYRKGLVHHLQEEQRHVRLYLDQMGQMQIELGDEPLFRHFWSSTGYLYDYSRFIGFMNLTLEQANLDFAPMYAHSFALHGDLSSAQVMQTILKEEIGHVALGLHWLEHFYRAKESQMISSKTLVELWEKNLPLGITPDRGYGFLCHLEPRTQAGLSPEWIDKICPEKSRRVSSKKKLGEPR